MTEIIKEIGIFIVVAQSLLYFVPGEAYAKYVKAVIGIAMIARLANPVLSLFSDHAADAVLEGALQQSFSFVEQPENSLYENAEENGQTLLISAIEEELAKRLRENPVSGYEVRDVAACENSSGEIQGIVVSVSVESGEGREIRIEKIAVDQEKDRKALEKEEEERLKKHYGEILEIPPEQIEIRLK